RLPRGAGLAPRGRSRHRHRLAADPVDRPFLRGCRAIPVGAHRGAHRLRDGRSGLTGAPGELTGAPGGNPPPELADRPGDDGKRAGYAERVSPTPALVAGPFEEGTMSQTPHPHDPYGPEPGSDAPE